jgi:hypothetical protein
MSAEWMVLTGTSGCGDRLAWWAATGGVDRSTVPPRRYLASMTPLSIPAIRGVRRSVLPLPEVPNEGVVVTRARSGGR